MGRRGKSMRRMYIGGLSLRMGMSMPFMAFNRIMQCVVLIVVPDLVVRGVSIA
jgi:hypothetical protein